MLKHLWSFMNHITRVKFHILFTTFPIAAPLQLSIAEKIPVYTCTRVSAIFQKSSAPSQTSLKRSIQLSVNQPDQFISPTLTRLKKDGSHRVIFNLKKLNDSVSCHHFKMDTLEAALKLMTPNCYMTSLDLQNAYYSIPIAKEHQKYLKFIWNNQLYAFTCLPMGLSSSPRIFTKLMKPVFATLSSDFGHIYASVILMTPCILEKLTKIVKRLPWLLLRC